MAKNGNSKANERQFEALSGGFMRFESKGDCAEGAYKGFTFQNGENGAYPQYHLLGDNGEPVSFNGTVQMIESLNRVPIGSYVMVTYTGETEKVAKGRVKIFEIQIEKGVELMPASMPGQLSGNAMGDPDAEAHWKRLQESE